MPRRIEPPPENLPRHPDRDSDRERLLMLFSDETRRLTRVIQITIEENPDQSIPFLHIMTRMLNAANDVVRTMSTADIAQVLAAIDRRTQNSNEPLSVSDFILTILPHLPPTAAGIRQQLFPDNLNFVSPRDTNEPIVSSSHAEFNDPPLTSRLREVVPPHFDFSTPDLESSEEDTAALNSFLSRERLRRINSYNPSKLDITNLDPQVHRLVNAINRELANVLEPSSRSLLQEQLTNFPVEKLQELHQLLDVPTAQLLEKMIAITHEVTGLTANTIVLTCFLDLIAMVHNSVHGADTSLFTAQEITAIIAREQAFPHPHQVRQWQHFYLAFKLRQNADLRAWFTLSPSPQNNRAESPRNLPPSAIEIWQQVLATADVITNLDELLLISSHPHLDTFMSQASLQDFDTLVNTHSHYFAASTYTKKLEITSLCLDNPQLVPTLLRISESYSSVERGNLPWSQRLVIAYQLGEALGLAGATENELTAVIMYRHYCDATGTPNQAKLDTFVEMNPSERWQEIARVRSRFDLDALRPYVAFVRNNPNQVAIYAEQLDIPVGPGRDPSPLPGVINPEFFDQFDELENQVHLHHLVPMIGYEREFRLPPQLKKLTHHLISPFLGSFGHRQGGGNSSAGIFESSPGPFHSATTAVAEYTLFNQLNFHVWSMPNPDYPGTSWLNFDAFHINRATRSQALTIATDYALMLTGKVRAPHHVSSSVEATSVAKKDNGHGPYFEDKMPNDITAEGTSDAIFELQALSTAQYAYEAALIDLEPTFKADPSILSFDAISGHNAKVIRNPHEEILPLVAVRKVNIIELTPEEITSSSLSPEQKKLALIYLRFLSTFRQGLGQVVVDKRCTLDTILQAQPPKESIMTLQEIFKTVVPQLEDYHNPERIFTTADPQSQIIFEGVIYPNLLAFTNELVRQTRQEVELALREADDEFFRLLFEVQIIAEEYARAVQLPTDAGVDRNQMMLDRLRNAAGPDSTTFEAWYQLSNALRALFSRFPCGLNLNDCTIESQMTMIFSLTKLYNLE